MTEQEYTPTTEEVWVPDDSDVFHAASRYLSRNDLDRWLAEHDRQVREELWDEIVPQYAHDWYWHDGGREQNPNRKEATGD